MSSSRAVTARRAAEANTVKTPQTGGGYGTQATANRQRPPGMSMGAQAAFAQAQYPPPQGGLNLHQQQALNQPPRKVGLQTPSRTIGPQLNQREQQQAYYGNQQGMPQQQGPQHGGKILMSDAIALVTLRLGAAEQNIIDMQEQIGDILMNGVGGAGQDEYDEDGNLLPPRSYGGAMAPGQLQAAAAAPPSEELEALKKEMDALKARLGGVEKVAKDAATSSGATKNMEMVIRKLTADNNTFKGQITQLTNVLNKNMSEMERKFDELTANVAKLAFEQQQMMQQMPYGEGEGDDGELHMEMDDIHAVGDEDLSDQFNPMWGNTSTVAAQNVIETSADDNTPVQPVTVANVAPELKPLEVMPVNAPRRMGAAAALIASQNTTAGGNKRPPAAATTSTSIDL
jgi:hypothetical protein